jgi:transcription termination factor Rho
MAVLDRPELEASPLADLHAIADQLGLEGFRRMRKPELIDAILGETLPEPEAEEKESGARAPSPARRRRRSASAEPAPEGDPLPDGEPHEREGSSDPAPAREPAGGRGRARSSKRTRSGGSDGDAAPAAEVVEGVVELLGNGSAFLRLNPPESSSEDVYVSAAQVRRCELVSGDRVSGPVRTPRRSERYPSLVRVEAINGAPADAVSDGSRYEDLPVAYPSELLALGKGDQTLEAIERQTPLGKGSRAVIVGPPLSGKSETLRRLALALSAQEGLDTTLVLLGARPEEIGEWQAGALQPVEALTFAASADSQGQALEQAIEVAKRVAARNGDAVVLIDGLDGVHPQSARKALAAARNLREGGSLTVIATATRPFGGESAVIALQLARGDGGAPVLDVANSATLKPELLVGERGAEAIARARAQAAQS